MTQHKNALFIVETLTQKGFIAYYAGGWVRDFLLNHPSDDIDIATNAPPETIQALFSHTVPIGIAFGIILVIINDHQYEVATFRQDLDYLDGRRPQGVSFSSPEEDAKRRDFTINGMFYDPINKKLIDYVGGQKDLADKIIRAIGDPHLRIKEDRLRMIRALRLKCRFHFSIDQSTQEAIHAHAQELFPSVAIERIVQELNKSLKTNSLVCMLKELDQFKLLEQIFPELNTRPIAPLLEPLLHYPRKTPLIIYLLALFPQIDLSTQTTLCKRLKISQTDQQLARFLLSTKLEINANNQELYTWAYIYANPLSYITLEIIKAHLSPSEKEDFHKTHQSRREHLKRSIERIQRLNPIVSSQDLMEEGIVPSHTMGLLLKAAETIAINEQIEEKEVIIQKLKTLPIWP